MERIRIKPRKEMVEFRIDELSAVDIPAQEHAKLAIIKRQDDADHVLNLKHTPLNGTEMTHYAKLTGDDRSRFVLADHATRKSLMEKTEMEKFSSFDELAAHYRKGGMSGTAAMQTARSSRPDLYTKMQTPRTVETDETVAIAKARDGRQRQNAVQAEIAAFAREKGIDTLDAARQLRRHKPALFA